MGSHSSKAYKDTELSYFKTKFSTQELEILSSIFTDLSSRDNGVISKDTFVLFFSLTGLWGERIFRSFDTESKGHLTLKDLLTGLITYCKSTEEEKIKILFDLYDIDDDGYIQKKELVTMLYNYPKQYLQSIWDEISPRSQTDSKNKLDEEKRMRFLPSLDIDFIKLDVKEAQSAKLKDASFATFANLPEDPQVHVELEILDELYVPDEKKDDIFQYEISRPVDNYNTWNKFSQSKAQQSSPLDLGQIDPFKFVRTASNSEEGEDKKNESPSRRRALNVKVNEKLSNINSPSLQKELTFAQHLRDLDTSMAQWLEEEPVKRLPSTVTPNARLRGYADTVFPAKEGEKKSEKMNLDQFKDWVKLHSGLLKIFNDLFHQDLWHKHRFTKQSSSGVSIRSMNEISSAATTTSLRESRILDRLSSYNDVDDVKSSKPSVKNYMSKLPEVCGVLTEKGNKSKYYELRGPFLLAYSKKDQRVCKGVIFLEDCRVDHVENIASKYNVYEFVISHSNPSYKPHHFTCPGKSEYEEWMSQLKTFNNTSINEYYTFHQKIGVGQYATVYKATSKKDPSKEYAIKVINSTRLSASDKQSIMSETAVLKILNHNTVIKLIETLEIQNYLYIVMELGSDGDLFDYIVNKQFLEEYEASFIMKKLLLSLTYIHNMGIIHRDLKPENIIISTDSNNQVSEIKLTDFGFSKFLCTSANVKEACGTPGYIAPEVFSDKGYGKKADIFSLGVIMYFLLKGRLPFDGPSLGEVLKKTFHDDVPLKGEHWRNVSWEAKDLLLKMLRKNPTQRIDLEECLKHPWIQQREDLKQYEGRNVREPVEN